MKPRILLAVAAVALPLTTQAMNKCVDAKGQVTFSDEPCPSGATGTQYTPPEITTTVGGGLREGEVQLYNQARQKDAQATNRKSLVWEEERRHRLSFDDRKRLRELDMRKRALTKSLSRGSKSWAEKMAISSEIKGIDREIEQIRSPKL